MHDGWEYVAFDYGVVALTLGAWFTMMVRKLRRLDRERRDG